jgi:hypothetical protein
MGQVHNLLQRWQGGQNLHTARKESHADCKQITSFVLIFDTDGIIKASFSLFQTDSAAAFTLMDTSPVSSALSLNDVTGGHTDDINVL